MIIIIVWIESIVISMITKFQAFSTSLVWTTAFLRLRLKQSISFTLKNSSTNFLRQNSIWLLGQIDPEFLLGANLKVPKKMQHDWYFFFPESFSHFFNRCEKSWPLFNGICYGIVNAAMSMQVLKFIGFLTLLHQRFRHLERLILAEGNLLLYACTKNTL